MALMTEAEIKDGYLIINPIVDGIPGGWDACMPIIGMSLGGGKIRVQAAWAVGKAQLAYWPAGWYQYEVHAPDHSLIWVSRIEVMQAYSIGSMDSFAVTVTLAPEGDTRSIQEGFEAEKKRIKETRKFYADE